MDKDKDKKKSVIIESSVVQIITDHVQINYSQPWMHNGKKYSTGTGFCIEWEGEKYIITNAHCVEKSTYIKIRRRGYADLFHAKIVWIIYECDLALLLIQESSKLVSQRDSGSKFKSKTKSRVKLFWEDLTPLTFGHMPNKLDTVYVYGYPLGGYNISITKGVISRVQSITYFDIINGIAIQIDAAINFGNSGGPVLNKVGEVIGIAFAGEDDSITQNMGYIIPPAIINFFLNSFKLNKKTNTKPNAREDKITFGGLCNLNISTQNLRNSVLRQYISIPDKKTGILITDITPGEMAHKYLKKYDVLMAIDGYPINNDGTMFLNDVFKMENSDSNLYKEQEIVPYTNYISLKNPGESVSLSIWRDNKEITTKVTLQEKYFNIPILDYQSDNSYYIILGLVFIPLSLMLIREKKKNKEYVNHLIELANSFSGPKDEQIIVLSSIAYTSLSEEYPNGNYILDTVNDISIRDISHLQKTVDQQLTSKSWVIFTFRDTSNVAIIHRDDVKKYNKIISKEDFGL